MLPTKAVRVIRCGDVIPRSARIARLHGIPLAVGLFLFLSCFFLCLFGHDKLLWIVVKGLAGGVRGQQSPTLLRVANEKRQSETVFLRIPWRSARRGRSAHLNSRGEREELNLAAMLCRWWVPYVCYRLSSFAIDPLTLG